MSIVKINQGRWFSSSNTGAVTDSTIISNMSKSPVFDLTVKDNANAGNVGVLQSNKGHIWYSQLPYNAENGETYLDVFMNQSASAQQGDPFIITFYVDISEINDDTPFLSTESYSGGNVLNNYFLQFVRIKDHDVYQNYLSNESKSLFCPVPNRFKFEMVSILDHGLPSTANTTFVHDHEIKINDYSVGCIPWVSIQQNPTHIRLCERDNPSVKISDISVYRYVQVTESPRARVRIVREDETDYSVTLRAMVEPDYITSHARIEILVKGSKDRVQYGAIRNGRFDNMKYFACLRNISNTSQKIFFKDVNGYGIVCNASAQAVNITGEQSNSSFAFCDFFDPLSTNRRVISAGTNCDTLIVLDFPEVFNTELVKGFTYEPYGTIDSFEIKTYINNVLV